MSRLDYLESCRLLQEVGLIKTGELPALPSGPASYENDPPGVSFFRMFLHEGALEYLSLPRTFICKSELSDVSLRNTDLSESSFCWNDFINVDFTDANLSGSDLRHSIYRNVQFVRADLREADLRASKFTACNFADALMQGAKLTRSQRKTLMLSETQQAEINWQQRKGKIPTGG